MTQQHARTIIRQIAVGIIDRKRCDEDHLQFQSGLSVYSDGTTWACGVMIPLTWTERRGVRRAFERRMKSIVNEAMEIWRKHDAAKT